MNRKCELGENHRLALQCNCWISKDGRKYGIDIVMAIIDKQFDDFCHILPDRQRVLAILKYIVRDNNDCVGIISWLYNVQLIKRIRSRQALKLSDNIKFLLLMKANYNNYLLTYSDEDIEDLLMKEKEDLPSLKHSEDAEKKIQRYLKTNIATDDSDDNYLELSSLITAQNVYEIFSLCNKSID